MILCKGIFEVWCVFEMCEMLCEIGVYEGNFVFEVDDVILCVKLIEG